MITIIIADDQKLFATSLKSVLENDDKELSVIGIAGNGKEAVDLAGQLKPDLILMDVRMPIMDGVEAVRIIHQRLPEIKIIMLTTYGDDEFVRHNRLFVDIAKSSVKIKKMRDFCVAKTTQLCNKL